MGKSFNDDIFNNNFNVDSINGLNISQEAINENKKNNDKSNLSLNSINLDEIKKEYETKKKATKEAKEDIKDILKENIEQNKKLQEQETVIENHTQQELYIKKTMIFKQEYLNIIDGLARINDMQIKDVLNQLLGKAINELDEKVRDKALKTGSKQKPIKTDKNLF